jgi:Tol biopolymer transport system component
MPLSVSSPKWFPDGARIAFVSQVVAGQETLEATKKAVEAREKNKVKARVTENRLYRYWDHWLTDGEYPRIFVVDVATKKVTDSPPGSKRIFGLDEGRAPTTSRPDGRWIAFEANSAPEPTASGIPTSSSFPSPAESRRT